MPHKQQKKILIAIDGSGGSLQAVTYVANWIRDLNGVHLRLFHVLPPIPPELREHSGAEDPDKEKKLSENLKEAQSQWIEKAKKADWPMVEKAESVLHEAHIPKEMVSVAFYPCVGREEIVGDILDAASSWSCQTIVVGRDSFSWFGELFRHHIGEKLVRKGHGYAIWVVE